ncbi:ExbD/TolR family protein [Aliikangiella coralliicola]|uniref:Biopolymer transporter ExbD n=1 Tax=Aliikangiella coralliicola TaxID=2592383 RepID=A0A545UHK6_9GAMM|nr:biopolymer transporter ExbD [Aliikangiella coralliicola]TQV88956.1 biopolymer transporter ExbD [Aliikangiella coralliicola]
MRRQRKHYEDETEVDMTPMLDIVFIMLIFFIVTTSFVKEDGIVLNRPAANPPDNPEPQKNRPIVIAISDSSEITIGGRLVDVNAVRANVETARAKAPNALVIVQAHESAKTGVVVSSVDQARLAGADKVTVVKPAK